MFASDFPKNQTIEKHYMMLEQTRWQSGDDLFSNNQTF
jgi:hypothetical protein